MSNFTICPKLPPLHWTQASDQKSLQIIAIASSHPLKTCHLWKISDCLLTTHSLPLGILQRESVEREGGEWPHLSRDHTENSPPTGKKSTQAAAELRSSQVALEPNPFEAGNAVIVSLLFYHCQWPGSLQSTLQIIMPHRCMAMDSPLTICKDLWRTQSRAFSLLFYSIRRVFFCSLQALGFNFWNIEFRLLLLSFPRLLKSVAIFSCSPHPLFFSWSWWIWIRKSLVAASIIFLIKDNIGLGTKACQKRSLSLSLNERLAPNYRPLFSCFLRLSSAWYEHLFSGLSGSCSGVMQKDHVPGHFLSSSEDIPERLVLINLLSQALKSTVSTGLPGGWSPWIFGRRPRISPGTELGTGLGWDIGRSTCQQHALRARTPWTSTSPFGVTRLNQDSACQIPDLVLRGPTNGPVHSESLSSRRAVT